MGILPVRNVDVKSPRERFKMFNVESRARDQSAGLWHQSWCSDLYLEAIESDTIDILKCTTVSPAMEATSCG